jgi:antitoxin CptB
MNKRSRLLWRCRRGTKEMDFLLQQFLEQEYDRLDPPQQALFEQFLDEQDPDIYAWITGASRPDNHSYQSIILQLQNIHVLLSGKT